MAVSRWRTDPAAGARLGPGTLADLKANLFAVDCQTCGRPFGRLGRPALEVQAEAGFGTASLHHHRCRPPAWIDGPVDLGVRRHLTWRAGCFLMPPTGLPVFLVNPSYEYALLREGDDGRWRVANLEWFTALGFQLELRAEPGPLLAALSASIDGGRISVDVRHEGSVPHAWHDVPIDASVTETVHAWGDILVAVTTLLDVGKAFRLERLLLMLGAGRVALGRARLASVLFDPAAQRLQPGAWDQDLLTRSFALSLRALELGLGVEFGGTVVGAAFAVCEGKEQFAGRLEPREKIAVALAVSGLFGLEAREKSGEPSRAGGVHLITPDAASAGAHLEFLQAAEEQGGIGSVGRLGADPLSAEGGEAYLADIVVGTVDEFAAAHSAYKGAGPDWELHASRGKLAVLSGVDAVDVDFIRHYSKVAPIPA